MEEGGVKGGRGGTVFKILIYIFLNCKIILEFETGGSSSEVYSRMPDGGARAGLETGNKIRIGGF